MADSKPDKVVRISAERWQWLVDYIAANYGDKNPTDEITIWEPTVINGILFLRGLYRAA